MFVWVFRSRLLLYVSLGCTHFFWLSITNFELPKKECSCYGEVRFNLVSRDEVCHPSLLFLYFLVFISNPGTCNIFTGKQVVSIEKDPWRLYAMPAWLQCLEIHSSSLGNGNFWSSVDPYEEWSFPKKPCSIRIGVFSSSSRNRTLKILILVGLKLQLMLGVYLF